MAPMRLLMVVVVGVLLGAKAGSEAPSVLPLPAAGSGTRITAGPGGVAVSWIEQEPTRLVTSAWTDAGWSAPETVAAIPDLFTTWADAPVVVTGGAHRLASWLVKAGEGHGAHLMVSRATPNGPWSSPVRVHEDTSETEHGFASFFLRGDGATEMVWLDGRGYAGGSNQTALLRRTLGADGELGDEQVIDERTCDCCPTTGVMLADGTPLLAYRDRIGGEVRDISAVRLGGEPTQVAEDGWEFAGCPVNGPGVARLGAGASITWLTEAAEPRVRLARSGADGAWTSVDLAKGDVRGRTVSIELGADSVLATWVQGPADGARLMGAVVTVDAVGAARDLGPADGKRSAGFHSMAVIGGQVLVAGGGIEPRLLSIEELRAKK